MRSSSGFSRCYSNKYTLSLLEKTQRTKQTHARNRNTSRS